jgi:group II intron reverse transcriptase/maturase
MAKGGSLSVNILNGRVREALRNPDQILNNLRAKACDESYPYHRLYRNLYNAELFLLAYQNIQAKEGNMTAGTDGKTIDGMGMGRINCLIGRLKDHSYQPFPARRKYIKKKNGKMRPLGIPSFEDKLVQEVVRMILESIYEPTFSELSHGFRPKRSCHTALLHLQRTFTGTKWFIEGDIKGFFDNIDHQVLVSILRKRIKDEYFISLIWKFLKAGYVEDWTFHKTFSGTPQGSIISPILSNIYLTEFDRYMERYMQSLRSGKKRTKSEEYASLEHKLKYLRYKKGSPEKWSGYSDSEKVAVVEGIDRIRTKMLSTDYSDPQDSGYKRLFYIRYADDWLCGVIGSKADAEAIKADIREYLKDTLKLELSDEKTLITNARDFAQFLSYDVCAADDERLRRDKNGHTRRTCNRKIKLYVPREKWQNKLIEYKALKIEYHDGNEVFKPVHRTYLISNDDLEILKQYNAEIRGLYNYYRIANNASVLGHFNYVMKFSMFKTFAAKYKSSIGKVKAKYGHKKFGVNYYTKTGPKTMHFYDDGFKRQTEGIVQPEMDIVPKVYRNNNPTSLMARLKAKCCECCGEQDVEIEIHHVRKLKDLKGKKRWEKLMIARRRKTLALCASCHDKLHAGELD